MCCSIYIGNDSEERKEKMMSRKNLAILVFDDVDMCLYMVARLFGLF